MDNASIEQAVREYRRQKERERSRRNYVANREKSLKYQREYAKEHREERQAYMRRYYEEHRERYQEYRRRYYQKHREEMVRRARERRRVGNECGGAGNQGAH